MKKRSDALTGAPVQADINDPYIQEIASTAVDEVDRRSNALYRQKVVKIVEAEKQVISMYFLSVVQKTCLLNIFCYLVKLNPGLPWQKLHLTIKKNLFPSKIGLKFEEETSEMLRLGHGSVWC